MFGREITEIGIQALFTGLPVHEILAGGLMLGAFFMATDYSSSPQTPRAQVIFAFGCGLLTVVIRVFGAYPEGVSYSILLMNLAVPLLDKYVKPRVYGTNADRKEMKEKRRLEKIERELAKRADKEALKQDIAEKAKEASE